MIFFPQAGETPDPRKWLIRYLRGGGHRYGVDPPLGGDREGVAAVEPSREPNTLLYKLFWGVVPFVPAHTNPRRRGSVIGRFAAEAAETRRRCSHGSLMQLALASLKTGTNSTDRNWTVPALCVSLPCNRCPVHGVSLCVGACLIPPILAIRVSLLERCWCNDVAGRIGIAELRDETAEWRRRHAFAVPS